MSNLEKLKKHVKKNKEIYILGVIIIAGFTTVIMRDRSSKSISSVIHGTADRVIHVVGEKVVMKDVSFISVTRQGPPSWVVRCIETGNIYTSQNSAAIAMGLSSSDLSRHLNGVLEHVGHFHFERICMAAV